MVHKKGHIPWNKGKKGCQVAWNKGKPWSEEVKAKFRLAKLGKKQSKETIEKRAKKLRLENNPCWKGGIENSSDGYILKRVLNHPNSARRGYVREHRLVMEKHLGRYLTKEEVVHHINGNRKDNRIENLQLFANGADHTKFHNNENRK